MERNKILLIVVVLGAVPAIIFAASVAAGAFFTVLDHQSCEKFSTGFSSSDVRVTDFEASDGELVVELRSSAADTVEIESIWVNGTTEGFEDRTLNVGESGVFSIPGFTGSSNCQSLDLRINYSVGAVSVQTEGSLNGRIEAD